MYLWITNQLKITILITDVLYSRLKWRARHHTPALVVAVTDNINEVVVALEQLPLVRREYS